MRVRLTVDIQGYAMIDGQYFEWPGRGREIDLPDTVARNMITAQQAVPVTTFEKEETMVPSAEDEERRNIGAARVMTQPPAESSRISEAAEVVVEPGSVPDPEPDPDPEPPRGQPIVRRGPGRPRKY